MESLKKAIAAGKSAAQISRESGVNDAVISKLISGKQQDLMTSHYFNLINCLEEPIKQEAMRRLGIEKVEANEIAIYLTGDEIAQIVPHLSGNDKAKILEAIAHSMLLQKAETKLKVPA
ncbi:hypothetical protein [Cylindrospermum stagnale]|uniref:hypothetical protein n=1 Tax=Cylindrospermum stagnale TaxID=142864 RepID=UPI0002E46E5E|nr:hypothetical protein [Cylindrospermum stagnale]